MSWIDQPTDIKDHKAKVLTTESTNKDPLEFQYVHKLTMLFLESYQW